MPHTASTLSRSSSLQSSASDIAQSVKLVAQSVKKVIKKATKQGALVATCPFKRIRTSMRSPAASPDVSDRVEGVC